MIGVLTEDFENPDRVVDNSIMFFTPQKKSLLDLIFTIFWITIHQEKSEFNEILYQKLLDKSAPVAT